MLTAFTRKYAGERGEGRMRFTFYCDICHSGYAAPSVQISPQSGPFLKWREQRACRAAFAEAQENAREHFNRCVNCMRWVYDADYRPDYGLCAVCDQNIASMHKQARTFPNGRKDF